MAARPGEAPGQGDGWLDSLNAVASWWLIIQTVSLGDERDQWSDEGLGFSRDHERLYAAIR